MNRFSLVGIPEVFSEILFSVLHDEVYRIKMRYNILDVMLDDGLATDLEKWLRSSIGEWSHARTLSRCHDNEIHS